MAVVLTVIETLNQKFFMSVISSNNWLSHRGAFQQSGVLIESKFVDGLSAAHSFYRFPTMLCINRPIQKFILICFDLSQIFRIFAFSLLETPDHDVLIRLFFSFKIRSVPVILPIIWMMDIQLVGISLSLGLLSVIITRMRLIFSYIFLCENYHFFIYLPWYCIFLIEYLFL